MGNNISKADWQPLAYKESTIKYLNAYQYSQGNEILELSIVLKVNNEAIGIWPTIQLD